MHKNNCIPNGNCCHGRNFEYTWFQTVVDSGFYFYFIYFFKLPVQYRKSDVLIDYYTETKIHSMTTQSVVMTAGSQLTSEQLRLTLKFYS